MASPFGRAVIHPFCILQNVQGTLAPEPIIIYPRSFSPRCVVVDAAPDLNAVAVLAYVIGGGGHGPLVRCGVRDLEDKSPEAEENCYINCSNVNVL